MKKINNLIYLFLLLAFTSSCSRDFSKIYEDEKEVLNQAAIDLLNNYDLFISGYKCNRNSNITEVSMVSLSPTTDTCFEIIPLEISKNINYLFSNNLIESIDLFENYVFFNIADKSNLTSEIDYFFVYAVDTNSINRFLHDKDFIIRQIDFEWFYVRFSFDE